MLPNAHMSWKGRTVPGTTYRHAWGYFGDLVRVRSTGDVRAAAEALARAAGLRGAWVCPEKNQREVAFEATDLPWDLVATKMAELTETEPALVEGVLRLECDGRIFGMGFVASATCPGSGDGLAGSVAHAPIREERLEGTLFFAGLVRLGTDGRADIDVPLPSRPGRWRVEALVMADDGGGARAHTVVHTRRSPSSR